MNTNPSIVPVPFHGANLLVVEHAGEPYVPMRPVVEGMGLSWQGQHEKFAGSRFATSVREILTQLPGDTQRRPMVCLPLRKLPGWLMSIHPNKVRAELRERIVQYQTECDDVLWQHWNQRASRTETATTAAPSTATDRAALTNAVRKMVAVFGKRGRALNFDDAWALVHVHMGVSGIHELPAERVPDAVAYVERLLEGELLGREAAPTLPPPAPTFGTNEFRNLYALCTHVEHLRRAWLDLEPALRALGSPFATTLHDRVIDSAYVAQAFSRRFASEFGEAHAWNARIHALR